jgi:hypothetical protein
VVLLCAARGGGAGALCSRLWRALIAVIAVSARGCVLVNLGVQFHSHRLKPCGVTASFGCEFWGVGVVRACARACARAWVRVGARLLACVGACWWCVCVCVGVVCVCAVVGVCSCGCVRPCLSYASPPPRSPPAAPPHTHKRNLK